MFLVLEEEDLLRYAVSVYGDDMAKICETLNSRSEQAIRAAIKRKVDPAVLESIGPKRKKKGHIAEDTSPWPLTPATYEPFFHHLLSFQLSRPLLGS